MALTMSKQEREAFLAETHVGLLSITAEGRGPLAIPIWYAYAPGGAVEFVTGATSRMAVLMRRAGRASLVAQIETPPYKYVSVEGRIAIVGAPDFERDVRRMAERYLGPEMAEMYLAVTADERSASESVLVRLTPEHWLSVDYTKMA